MRSNLEGMVVAPRRPRFSSHRAPRRSVEGYLQPLRTLVRPPCTNRRGVRPNNQGGGIHPNDGVLQHQGTLDYHPPLRNQGQGAGGSPRHGVQLQ